MPSDLSLHTGAFELLEPIARGGMADVWRARHIRTERLAAVKVLRKDTADHTRFRQSFLTDAQSIARIAHPNVVQLYDTGDVTADVAALSQGKLTAGSPYLVMEYAPNGALAEGLLLRWASLRTTLRQVLAGLAHTHSRGMIHLDVKPGNILAWGRDPATWHLKLTDFGTARRFVERERADTERWHVVQGTPLYMSPEQFDTNWRRITPASDVYGVGVVAFELATGNPPFMGDSVLDILKQHLSAPRNIPELDAPSAFSGWLRKALDPSLQRRFATAGTALRALDTLQEPIRVTSLASWREADVRLPTPLIEDEKLRLLALRDPPLVGREREQDILWSALQRTLTTGRAHTVVLSGVSGAGKTRLASWLGERAAELGIARFVHARHDRIAADHLGLQGLLDQLLNVRDADASTVRDQIAEVLARDARSSEKAQTLSYRTAVLADYLRPRTGGYATVENQSGDVEAAHRRVIEVLAQKEPLVVLLDDAHWDLSSLRLAEELALNGQGPVLVLVTVRDEDLEDLPASRGALDKMFASRVERLELGPLDRRATSTLISELTNLDGPSQRLLVDRTDGNPLFAIALVQQLIDSGAITVRDGNARLVRSDGLDRVALDDVWLDRVERALREIASALVADVGFEDLREALEIGCALGSAINIAEWEDACAHLPENATNAVTAALALANLAERGDRLVVLRHPMVREAVSAASVARGTSLERHSCAARALSARVEATGNLSRENAVRVGRHYVEAEDNHEALRWLSIATSRDFSRPLTTIAFSLYPLFLSVVERVGEPNLTIDQQLDYLHLTAIVAQNDGASVSNLGDVLSRWSDLAHKHGHVVHFCLAQQVRAYEALFRGDIHEGLR
ncbi:MAG: serine/threonine protein kinase, partial [Flavobacteriales bacterium]